MIHFEALKERLKRKPEVHPNEGVKVIIAPQINLIQEEIKIPNKPLITIEKDEGKRALDILERIKQKKLTAVIRKIPEEEKAPFYSKAPVIEPEKKKKLKKLKEETIILEEEPEKVGEELPKGGPRLEEILPEKVFEEKDVKEVTIEAPIIDKEIEVRTQPRIRSIKKIKRGVIEIGPASLLEIGDTSLAKRLPPVPIFNVKVSSYFMNNREIFVNFINGLFEPYKEELLDETKGISCGDMGKETGETLLLTHQKIVRDYINLYSPYRGLLLYHGLGSGKTCSSIAIAEGMKSSKKIIIMTPASLRRNYIEEIKKCGDLLYRKNQYWEWISIDTHPEYIDTLSMVLGLPREYIRRHHGAWLVNITKPSNYTELSASDKKILNDQLDEMINNKYTFINYNGLRRSRFKQLTNNLEDNIFDNSVVIIDEAHNLISRIVNKINKIAKYNDKKRGPGALLPQSLALLLYEFLLNADNCRIVLLTGTPIINYPNEIAILFNILRGYIKTWNFTLSTETNKKLSKETLQDIFAREKVLDYIDYIPSSKTLTVTRNPYGFENKITSSSGYKGVTNEKKEKRNEKGEIEVDSKGNILYEERGQISDSDFIQRIVKILKRNDITAIANGTTYNVNTALPDTLDEFVNIFINKDTGNLFNVEKFKRRIIGLTSYFRSAQEELLPSYDRNFDKHEVYIPMSDYQFKVYEDYRHEERTSEKPNKKTSATIDPDGIFKEPSSTYRIFSRLACNFVMPKPPGRPNPTEYRLLAQVKKNEKLMAWIKDSYFKDKDSIDNDFQVKYDEFISSIPEENLNDKNNYENIKYLLDQYLREYLQKGYRDSIQIFFTKMGYEYLFNMKNKKSKAEEVALVVEEIKPEIEPNVFKKKEKQEIKALEKAAKEKEREEAKIAKQKEKEDAKTLKKAEKEKVKEEAKMIKQKEKEDAKLARELERMEKKKSKMGKNIVGGSFNEEDENEDKEIDWEDDNLSVVKEDKDVQDEDEDENDDEDDDEDEDDDDDDDEDDDEDEVHDDEKEEKHSIENDNQKDNEFYGGVRTNQNVNSAEEFVDDNLDNDNISNQLLDYKDEDAILREADELESDEILETMGNIEYREAIKAAMKYLQLHSREFLSPEGLKTYSPKFLAMLDNIEDPEHPGLHLVYSQFRSMEGIGIFCLVLEANGFAEFKIKRTGENGWEINMSEEEMGKPCFALYTGTEDAEEREIIRNIYNGMWDYIPNNIATQLRAKSSNNNLGEIIKILMITSAGSEGINLRNTRYVHIMEPYWHPVRVEQVIGRARRICSHQSLPKELQTVEVFIYIMTYTEKQLDSDFAIELKLKDVSKNPPYLPQTSDQKLFEISTIKEQLTSQLLKAVKESSIDCATYIQSNTKEGLVCLSFGQPTVNDWSYNPNYSQDENDTVAALNVEKIDWEARPFTLKSTGKRYMLRMDTKQVYDFDSVIQAKQVPGVRPILIGKLIKNPRGDFEIVKEKV